MATTPRQGRPRASSREVLAEAACELFLEQGYEATSVSDITARAGVSRSSFFNYFASKHDVLWAGVDEHIATLVTAVSAPGAGLREVRAALGSFADDLQPDALALAFANAEAMGAQTDLAREAGARSATMSEAMSVALVADGFAPLRAVVVGGAYAGAVIAALERWALDGSGRTSLADRLDEAVGYVDAMPGAAPER